MHKITLVCSAHRENGLCNAEELINILRAFEPDVVFEEIRPSDFDSYCKHGASLEARAVTRYREFKSFQRVPVDRYDLTENLLVEIKRDLDCVFDLVTQKSHEYRLLDDENNQSVCQLGFGYLNSVACTTKLERMSEIEDTIISGTGNHRLIRALEWWRKENKKRDLEMIGSIYEYCRENVFSAGVFLVGAAHKATMVKEIEKYSSAEKSPINWNLRIYT